MTKAEVRAAFPALLAQWKAKQFPSVGDQALRSSDFIDWLRQHYPQTLVFRSTMGAEYDLDQWFAAACSQGWRD